MTWDAWILSARLAWSRPWMRYPALLAAAACIGFSIWFLIETVPAVRHHDAFIFHYNIYLGIDDVRAWEWVFCLPLAWLVMTVFELVSAFGLYRPDPHLSRALMILATAGIFPWAGILFYLSIANV